MVLVALAAATIAARWAPAAASTAAQHRDRWRALGEMSSVELRRYITARQHQMQRPVKLPRELERPARQLQQRQQPPPVCNSTCKAAQREAVLAVLGKAAPSSRDLCTWPGVHCCTNASSAASQLPCLLLGGVQELRFALLVRPGRLQERLTPSAAQALAPSLVVLDLMSNQLQGQMASSGLGALTNLQELYLANNMVCGSAPRGMPPRKRLTGDDVRVPAIPTLDARSSRAPWRSRP